MDFPKNLHHAYILEGDISFSRQSLFSFLKEAFDIKPGNPDLFLLSSKSFTMENSQELIQANLRKPISSSGILYGKKFIVADFSSISIGAQNSLLKTLEEPYPGTHIFLITETSSLFLPTVLSRVHILSSLKKDLPSQESDEIEKSIVDAKKFLSFKAPARLEMIKVLMAEKESEKIYDSDIERLVTHIELLAYKHSSSNENVKKIQVNMTPFLIVDEYLRDMSSLKILLEYLALTLPTLSI